MTTCSFTGHRGNNSSMGGYDWFSFKNERIRDEIYNAVIHIINESIEEEKNYHFIFGGAIGVDQFAFDVVNEIKKNASKLKLITITTEIAIPFINQDAKWKESDCQRWRNQLSIADKVTKVDRLEEYKIKGYEEDIYYPAKMQKRNEYMVDNSDIIIAVWDGSKGGTYNCVKYAQRINKKMIQLNPKNIE